MRVDDRHIYPSDCSSRFFKLGPEIVDMGALGYFCLFVVSPDIWDSRGNIKRPSGFFMHITGDNPSSPKPHTTEVSRFGV